MTGVVISTQGQDELKVVKREVEREKNKAEEINKKNIIIIINTMLKMRRERVVVVVDDDDDDGSNIKADKRELT